MVKLESELVVELAIWGDETSTPLTLTMPFPIVNDRFTVPSFKDICFKQDTNGVFKVSTLGGNILSRSPEYWDLFVEEYFPHLSKIECDSGLRLYTSSYLYSFYYLKLSQSTTKFVCKTDLDKTLSSFMDNPLYRYPFSRHSIKETKEIIHCFVFPSIDRENDITKYLDSPNYTANALRTFRSSHSTIFESLDHAYDRFSEVYCPDENLITTRGIPLSTKPDMDEVRKRPFAITNAFEFAYLGIVYTNIKQFSKAVRRANHPVSNFIYNQYDTLYQEYARVFTLAE